MAERVGFEPTNELPRRWFSRPVLSTAQPPLQYNYIQKFIGTLSIIKYTLTILLVIIHL